MYHWILKWLFAMRVRLAFLVVRLLPLVSQKHDALGIRVYLGLSRDDEIARAREQLNLSIALIAHYEPRRYVRLKADLRGILVYPFAVNPRARYNCSTGFCELSPSLALTDDIATIASSIVHEGTHARLRRLETHTPERRLRIERVCIAQQVVFLEKLPGMRDRASEIRSVLEGLRLEDHTDRALWSDMLAGWEAAGNAWRRR